jgi:hypothetical protein
MKMADGGFRPAYNVQFATDGFPPLCATGDVSHIPVDSRGRAPSVRALMSVRSNSARPPRIVNVGNYGSLWRH